MRRVSAVKRGSIDGMLEYLVRTELLVRTENLVRTTARRVLV